MYHCLQFDDDPNQVVMVGDSAVTITDAEPFNSTESKLNQVLFNITSGNGRSYKV